LAFSLLFFLENNSPPERLLPPGGVILIFGIFAAESKAESVAENYTKAVVNIVMKQLEN
jgi:hypothetical protein